MCSVTPEPRDLAVSEATAGMSSVFKDHFFGSRRWTERLATSGYCGKCPHEPLSEASITWIDPNQGGCEECDCKRKWQDWVRHRNAFHSDVLAFENGTGQTTEGTPGPRGVQIPPPTWCYPLIF